MNVNLNATVDVVVDTRSLSSPEIVVHESRRIDAVVSMSVRAKPFRRCVNVNDQGGVQVQVHVNVKVAI